MIHFERVPEPPGFDAEVRARGRAWLADHPAPARPRAFWAPYVRHLAAGFRHLCGYTAMHIDAGTVDSWPSTVIAAESKRLRRAADSYIDRRVAATQRVAAFQGYERLFSLWHALHIPLIFMLIIAAVVPVPSWPSMV